MSAGDAAPPVDLSQRLAAIEKLIDQTRQYQASTQQRLDHVQALVGEWDGGRGKNPLSDSDQSRSRMLQLENALGDARQHQQAIQLRFSEAEMQARYWQQTASNRQAALDGVTRSLSWKVTAPLRAFMQMMRGGKPRTPIQSVQPASPATTPLQAELFQPQAGPNADRPAPDTMPMSATAQALYSRLTHRMAVRTRY